MVNEQVMVIRVASSGIGLAIAVNTKGPCRSTKVYCVILLAASVKRMTMRANEKTGPRELLSFTSWPLDLPLLVHVVRSILVHLSQLARIIL
jgi:hypothetical protein